MGKLSNLSAILELSGCTDIGIKTDLFVELMRTNSHTAEDCTPAMLTSIC